MCALPWAVFSSFLCVCVPVGHLATTENCFLDVTNRSSQNAAAYKSAMAIEKSELSTKLLLTELTQRETGFS